MYLKMMVSFFGGGGGLDGLLREPALLLTQLVLVLLPETVPGGEEVPAPLLVHLPHVRLLQNKQGNVS